MNTNFYGTDFRFAPISGILGMKHFSRVELRYGHDTRTRGIVANIVTMALKMK